MTVNPTLSTNAKKLVADLIDIDAAKAIAAGVHSDPFSVFNSGFIKLAALSMCANRLRWVPKFFYKMLSTEWGYG